ncbi:hypothetical protein HKD37_04G010556 [Glycine soja]
MIMSAKTLNEKLLKKEDLKDQPQDVIKHCEAIDTLKSTLTTFVSRSESLDNLIRYYRCLIDRSSNVYEGIIYVHDEDIVVCYVCGKVEHMTSKFRNRSRKGASNAFKTTKRGPKKIWVPKEKIIHVVDVLGSRNKTPIMVPGQWLLTTHDRKKVYGPMLDSLS